MLRDFPSVGARSYRQCWSKLHGVGAMLNTLLYCTIHYYRRPDLGYYIVESISMGTCFLYQRQSGYGRLLYNGK